MSNYIDLKEIRLKVEVDNIIPHTESFSAIASKAAVQEDFEKMRSYLLAAGIPEEKCSTNRQIHDIVLYIASCKMDDTVVL